jgi:hypothetical protein
MSMTMDVSTPQRSSSRPSKRAKMDNGHSPLDCGDADGDGPMRASGSSADNGPRSPYLYQGTRPPRSDNLCALAWDVLTTGRGSVQRPRRTGEAGGEEEGRARHRGADTTARWGS